MGSELTQEGIGLENANRMYTEAEDQLILSKWWNKRLRTELAQELGRSEAALAQRFYAILKKQGLDPKAYRASMRKESTGRHLQFKPAPSRPWTRDEDIVLWRTAKAGESFAAIAAVIPDRTPEDCQERYDVLRQANATADTFQAVEAIPISTKMQLQDMEHGAIGPEEDGVEAARVLRGTDVLEKTDGKQEEPDDFLDVLKRFPQQAGALSHRMDAIESDMSYVRNNLQFVLENLAQGLNNVAQYLVGQEQDFSAFQRVRQENQALRDELTQLKQRVESEKKELRKVYNELEFWLGEFLEMRKIEKVANLGELIPKLKYSYDRFGVLLQIEREA